MLAIPAAIRRLDHMSRTIRNSLQTERHPQKKVRPKPLGAHALRRTFGHMMLTKSVPLEVVSKLLGHSSTLVTQQAYAALDAQTAAKHLDVWSALLEDD